MKSLLSLLLILFSFSAFSYFDDNYYFYRFPRKKVLVKKKKKDKKPTKEEKVVHEVDVDDDIKPSSKNARKFCYGLGYISATRYKVEISADGKLARLASVSCYR